MVGFSWLDLPAHGIGDVAEAQKFRGGWVCGWHRAKPLHHRCGFVCDLLRPIGRMSLVCVHGGEGQFAFL
jgi:hypothetical protein